MYRTIVPFRTTLLVFLCLTSQVYAADPKAFIQFETQIQPLLTAKCVKCHGDQKRSAELSLSKGTDLFQGSESGQIVIAGKPEESRLYEVLHNGEMPPEGNPAFEPVEVELIKRWIIQGAQLNEAPKPTAAVTQHQIIPLMLLRCTACHGGRRTEGGLDLRTKAGMLKGGKSGPAVVAGKPDESLIVRKIKAEEMPPRRLLVSVSVKPMEQTELQRLESWIAAGLPEIDAAPDVATDQPDKLVSDEDRKFWSFQPPRQDPPPLESLSPENRAKIENPIDAFILAKLQPVGLTLSPRADRPTLIRRATIDLAGLPPTPEEVEEFVQDSSLHAYQNLIDRLLASPKYGERWARHWLDVAGYADSEGAQNEDRVRPNMWRYRDYVIRSLNSDKPYDRFLLEQIAGDELADYENAPIITQEIYDNLVATGFLRTAPDRTFANITNFVPDRLEIIADEIQVLGSAVMGLTIHCARCHTHKFDPLPQRDYYRLAAALKDALDEHDWLGPESRQLNAVTTQEREAYELHEQQIANQIEMLKKQSSSTADEIAKKSLLDQIKSLEAQRQPRPTIRALWSRGDPSPTYLLQRGNYLTTGQEVGPGIPSMLNHRGARFEVKPPWPGAKVTGRRLALARWLTETDHPLTGRVLVNRIWKHHFQIGIVSTLANFGKTGAAPTHPELLDWLAYQFSHQGWSLKSLHRLLMTSATYQQSSLVLPEQQEKDPDNRLLSRMPLRRMEAEVIRDSLLFVSGQLNLTPYGPPDDVEVRGDGLVTVRDATNGSRRSIYALHRRTKLPTILESFDSPQMGPNCVERGESIVAPQALHLLNNGKIHDMARFFAQRVIREGNKDRKAQIARIYQLATGIAASAEELELAEKFLLQLELEWIKSPGSKTTGDDSQRALENLCHAILNSAAFVYVD